MCTPHAHNSFRFDHLGVEVNNDPIQYIAVLPWTTDKKAIAKTLYMYMNIEFEWMSKLVA